jgi:hypothetical protein
MKKLLLLSALILASCSSRPVTRERINTAGAVSVLDTQTLASVLQCINDLSLSACSLSGEGTITLKDGSNSDGGHFELKSKRLQGANMPERVDSLSMIVSGPFGITGVKFLGAPEEYQFYNAIEGEKYNGKPDAKTLQSLTGMKGLSLPTLSDVIYGLIPNDIQMPGDSISLKSVSEFRHVVYKRRAVYKITEMITLNGKLPVSPQEKANLTIMQYDRWNRIVPFDSTSVIKPDISVSYQGLVEKQSFPLPSFISARSGVTELDLEYSSASVNPKDLTVKIKMPK